MSPLADLRFLIVDDHAAMRASIRRLLAELGADRADEAADGRAALHRLRSGGHDIVLSDINMPVMNGFDLLESMQADASLCRIPVLLFSAEARPDDIVFAARRGAAGLLVKPLSRAMLADKLRWISTRVMAFA